MKLLRLGEYILDKSQTAHNFWWHGPSIFPIKAVVNLHPRQPRRPHLDRLPGIALYYPHRRQNLCALLIQSLLLCVRIFVASCEKDCLFLSLIKR
jgi:hypothetical protein